MRSPSLNGRPYLRAEVPTGDNRGKVFTVAQPLAHALHHRTTSSRPAAWAFFWKDRRPHAMPVLIRRACLRRDPVRQGPRSGRFTNQLRLPRKTLEMERAFWCCCATRLQCGAAPNDFAL